MFRTSVPAVETAFLNRSSELGRVARLVESLQMGTPAWLTILGQRKVGKTTMTTNRCCSHYRNNHDGTKEKGYFLCHAKDGKIERKFIEAKMG